MISIQSFMCLSLMSRQTGFDPAEIRQTRMLLKELCKKNGMTVIISGHILSEIESIADTVGIIHHGQMLKEISMRDIKSVQSNSMQSSSENYFLKVTGEV